MPTSPRSNSCGRDPRGSAALCSRDLVLCRPLLLISISGEVPAGGIFHSGSRGLRIEPCGHQPDFGPGVRHFGLRDFDHGTETEAQAFPRQIEGQPCCRDLLFGDGNLFTQRLIGVKGASDLEFHFLRHLSKTPFLFTVLRLRFSDLILDSSSGEQRNRNTPKGAVPPLPIAVADGGFS